MHKKILDRINQLARKSREGGLTPAEVEERDALRQQYLKLFREGFRQQLMGVKIVDPTGKDITPEKLRREQEKNKN